VQYNTGSAIVCLWLMKKRKATVLKMTDRGEAAEFRKASVVVIISGEQAVMFVSGGWLI